MRHFFTRAACHFLGHEDQLYDHLGRFPVGLFPVVRCIHCGEMAPRIFQPENPLEKLLDDLCVVVGEIKLALMPFVESLTKMLDHLSGVRL